MKILSILFTPLLILVLTLATSTARSSSDSTHTATPYETACTELSHKKFADAEAKLAAVFDFEWNHEIEESPEFATSLGLDINQDKWGDMSLTSIAQRKLETACGIQLGQSVLREALKSDESRLNLDLFMYRAKEAAEGVRFPEEYLAISPVDGVHQELASILTSARHTTVHDFDNLIARLNAAPKLIEQNQILLQEGILKGITQPAATLAGVPAQFDSLITKKLEKNSLYLPFLKIPDSIDEKDQLRIRASASQAILEKVIPSLTKFRDFLVKDYIAKARHSIAFSDLPDGKAWYAYRAKASTTTQMTPQEIHEIGLKEVTRIQSLMEQTMREAKFKKGLTAFFHFLRTDKRFFFQHREELLSEYRNIAKRADPELPTLFGKLPRLPYGVRPVPNYNERNMPAAYYDGGSTEARRPGYFTVNAYALESRPKWEMEDLLMHEAVPGHHLQIAIAQEQTTLPNFRRHGYFNAFTEGWGLYAETIGYDLGFYTDPYSKMGQLSGEMWRACRLVVDTGMHSLGWSREQAVQFMLSHMPKPEHDIRVEVDRYLSWPGQALSYKIGQMKITELKLRAKTRLGARFDIRAFHDQILAEGALPLDVLDAQTEAWIKINETAAHGLVN